VANSKLFDSNASQAIKAAHRRKWTLISFVIVLLIVIVSLVVYHEITTSQENIVANQYSEIDNIFNQENLAFQQKVQEQKNTSTTQAGNSRSPQIEPDYSESMPKFRDYALKYPANPYGWQAAIRSSTYFITNNKLDYAQKGLEAVLPYTFKSDFTQIKIRTALAGIYANQNKSSKAIEQLTIVENLPHNPIPNQSRFLKAQIFVAAGNKNEAKKVLNQIISTPTESDFSAPQANDLVHQAKILLNRVGL